MKHRRAALACPTTGHLRRIDDADSLQDWPEFLAEALEGFLGLPDVDDAETRSALSRGLPDTPPRMAAAGMTVPRSAAFAQVRLRFVDKAPHRGTGHRPGAEAVATIG